MPKRRAPLRESENDIKRTILAGLAAKGIPAFRLNSGAVAGEYKGKRRFMRFTFKGCPDIVALLPSGNTLWIEVKTRTGQLSEAQVAFRDLCLARHVPWILARSWEGVADWLKC